MTVKNLLRVTAVLEGGMALAFLLLPVLSSMLLFGQTPNTSLALILGRFVGAVLLSLSLACWWAANDAGSPAASGVVKTMLFYDVIAIVLLVHARVNLGLSGIVLWPGVIVHVALAAWCVAGLQGGRAPSTR